MEKEKKEVAIIDDERWELTARREKAKLENWMKLKVQDLKTDNDCFHASLIDTL